MVSASRAPRLKGFKTFQAKPSELKKNWWLVDASGQNLGRMAARIAMRLMGKDQPIFTPHIDTGDFVVIVNAEKVFLHPSRRKDKTYRHWSGYLGGLKETSYPVFLAKHPEEVIRHSVRLMLPKTVLGKAMLGKLKIYRGPAHPHAAQKPKEWKPLG